MKYGRITYFNREHLDTCYAPLKEAVTTNEVSNYTYIVPVDMCVAGSAIALAIYS